MTGFISVGILAHTERYAKLIWVQAKAQVGLTKNLNMRSSSQNRNYCMPYNMISFTMYRFFYMKDIYCYLRKICFVEFLSHVNHA